MPKISVRDLKTSPFQVRSKMNGQPLTDLIQSMRQSGLVVPVKVRPAGAKYELIYGHRRVEAAKKLGWKDIDAIVAKMDDRQAQLEALAENVQRDDLEPMDLARALGRLRDQGMTLQQIAGEVGLSYQHVHELLALLNEPQAVQAMVGRSFRPAERTVTERHVRDIRNLGLPAKEKTQVLNKAAREELSSPQTRKVAQSMAAAKSPAEKQVLLKKPYNPIWHDPKETRRVQAEARRTQPSPGREWEDRVEVIDALEWFSLMRKQLPKLAEAIRIGKFSPEARRFLANRLRPLLKELDVFLAYLEK